MKQLIAGALIGGIILFLWGWLSWSLIPIHAASIRNIENEDALISEMEAGMNQRGVYAFPAMPLTQDEIAMDDWEKKYKRGPVGMIIYDPAGNEPAMPSQMIVGFLISIISAYIASWFLSRSTAVTASYFARIAYCGMLGIFVSIVSHLVNWNWMGYPPDYTIAWVSDAVIGWLLAGAGIAAVVKAPAGARS